MLLLAIDTVALPCSVALGDEERLLGEFYLDVKRTHSQRLMPLIVSLFEETGIVKEDVQGIAVTIGPGSFTGIRIGMATAQGLAQGLDIPVVGVMTLEALVGPLAFFKGLLCPVLDAKKNQVYTALYRGGDWRKSPQEVEPPAALSLEQLCKELQKYTEDILFTGDGVLVYGEQLKRNLGHRYQEVPFYHRFNRAALVLQKGLQLWQEKGPTSPYALRPFYLRSPEAERLYWERSKKGGSGPGSMYRIHAD